MAQKYFKADIPRIQSLCISRGWSREQLASKAIVSTRTLDSLWAGKEGLLSTFAKIAKALETPVKSIVVGFEPPQPPKDRRWTVTIQISAPYDAYDETQDLPDFLKKLLSRVGGDEIWGAQVSAGSTIIRFYLTYFQRIVFVNEYSIGTLDDFGIIDVKIDSEAHVFSEAEGE